MSRKLIFTLDVEEWFHSENIAPYWEKQFSDYSSLKVMFSLLDFLDTRNIKGTFFFLGLTACENQELLREVKDRGHEIASHGWDHTLLNSMTKLEIATDIYKATSSLEDIIGEKIVGYRSPCFSQSEFLIETLLENGYLYTSNGIRSTFHDRYSNNFMTDIRMFDFALPVASLGPLNIPATGGGWFRLFPVSIQKLLIGLSRQEPKVFYAHPVDFDDNLPDLDFIGALKYWRQTVNSKYSFSKLAKFDFSNNHLKIT